MRKIAMTIGLLAVLVLMSRYSATQTAPPTKPQTAMMTAAELERLGDDARAQKDYPAAVQYYQDAVAKDRRNPTLYNKLGLAELKRDDLAAARLNFQKAVKQNPNFVDAVNNIGAVDYMNKNFKSAQKYFKKAAGMEETRATFHVNLGAALFSLKNMDRAVAEYTRALELDPNAFGEQSKVGVAAQISSPEERAQYSYLLAKIYAKRGDVESCIHCLKKAKEDGYNHMQNVYKDQEFAKLRDDPRLHEVVEPPVAK